MSNAYKDWQRENALEEQEEIKKGFELKTIGTSSSIGLNDARWLDLLADHLYEEGWYTKSIYLTALLDHATHCTYQEREQFYKEMQNVLAK